MMRVGIQEVSKRLADEIENVCLHLFPAGKRNGGYFEVGSVNGERGKTLKVNLNGSMRGRWVDWNGQEQKGDALDLWAAAKGTALPVAFAEAKRWLGIKEIELAERDWKKPADDKPAINDRGKVMHWFSTNRKITTDIVNRFKIQGDSEKKAVVFPSYSPEGKLINRSYRALELDADGKKRVWQDKGAAPSLFGWQALSEKEYEAREILICEGQIDAMTWTQWGIPALSIPNGSGKTWIEYEWQNLEAFKTIFLALDQDAAGKKNVDEIVARLGRHRIRLVEYPHKDANDALVAGVVASDAAKWVSDAKYAKAPNLVSAGHYSDAVAEEFFPSKERAGHVIPATTHPNPELSFRFRPGELTIWTGVSFHGKSTVLNYALLVLCLSTKRPALDVSLEMPAPKILKRVILGTGAVISSREDAKKANAILDKWMLFCDKNGSITEDELFELLEYAYARYGIANVAIDSLMRISGLEENYPAQNAFVTRLVKFARDTGVHVHLVAHPRKTTGNNAPESHDIKGSGHIRDNADNVLVVWRNREKEKLIEEGDSSAEGMPDAKIMVEKDREDGTFREFPLNFNPATYSYSRCEVEQKPRLQKSRSQFRSNPRERKDTQ